MKPLLIFLSLMTSVSHAGSSPEKLIDLDKLTPTIKKRMIAIGGDHYSSVQNFQPSVGESLNSNDYAFNAMTFEINADIETVWNAYLTSDPKVAWNGKMLQFDFAYSKKNNEVYYRDSKVPQAHVGMGIFMVLNLWNLKKMPAALEVTKIDNTNKIVEFTYLTVNTAHGRQSIRLLPLANHRTQIQHNTFYKSESHFRDQRLYPMVHEALLEEFHQNVMNQIGLKAVRIK